VRFGNFHLDLRECTGDFFRKDGNHRVFRVEMTGINQVDPQILCVEELVVFDVCGYERVAPGSHCGLQLAAAGTAAHGHLLHIPAADVAQTVAAKDLQGARDKIAKAVKSTMLISIPCAVGLAVLAEPVTALLGGYSGERLELASSLMCVLGICIVFNATVLLTNAIMQANGHAVLPVVNMFVGGFIKLAAVLILTGNPHIGILGTPLGSLLSYFIITVLNLITMKVVLKDPPAIVKNMLRGLLSAAVMGGVTFG